MFLKSILVPLDGSPLSERALPYAAELARAARASLTLVRTAEVQPSLPPGLPHLRPEDPWRYLHMQADLLRTGGLVVDTAVAPGDAPPTLVSAIERRQPDLVVMSTHGRSGIDRLVHGSVTDAVISHAGSPHQGTQNAAI
jgi:nucleotide-binding universal stress UspA family protein